jgi:hypothetical protein
MAHRYEHVPTNAEPLVSLTDDLHAAPVRLWVDYKPRGDDDLCLVFKDGGAFRAWLDELLSEADRQNLIRGRLLT